ncbi:MAG: hypothetical protein VX589_20650 [Myxococcota bacterium]|nr:hypothetical protein [Myxococcota bacterium]
MTHTELSQTLAKCQRRAWWMRIGVVFSVASAGAAVCICFAADDGYFIAIAVAAVVVSGFKPPLTTFVRRADGLLDTMGSIECAFDNRNGDAPVVVAQRSRAARQLAEIPMERLVPMPHPLWVVPYFGLMIAALQTDGSTYNDSPMVGESAGTSSVARATTSPRNDAAAASVGKRAKKTVGLIGAVTTHRSSERANPQPISQAQRGKRTGRSIGPSAGRRLVRLDDGSQAVPEQPQESQLAKRQEAVTAGVKPPSMHAIAQPTRAYPERYRQVISAWFQRKGTTE